VTALDHRLMLFVDDTDRQRCLFSFTLNCVQRLPVVHGRTKVCGPFRPEGLR